MEDIRKLTKVLVAPANDKSMGLIASVNELVSDITIVKDIHIVFDHSRYAEAHTDGAIKVIIYRIIQEQLSNIIKHANAQEASINLSQDGLSIHLTISDNGVGFDTSKNRNGIGITNIKNRAATYNGTAHFNSQPGQGCVLSVIFPSSHSDQ